MLDFIGKETFSVADFTKFYVSVQFYGVCWECVGLLKDHIQVYIIAEQYKFKIVTQWLGILYHS